MRRLFLTAVLLLLLAAGAAPLGAQAPADPAAPDAYKLTWFTVDGGGIVASTGGVYTLSGTAGQADTRSMGGGQYRLTGGFWGGLAPLWPGGVYLPLVLQAFP